MDDKKPKNLGSPYDLEIIGIQDLRQTLRPPISLETGTPRFQERRYSLPKEIFNEIKNYSSDYSDLEVLSELKDKGLVLTIKDVKFTRSLLKC